MTGFGAGKCLHLGEGRGNMIFALPEIGHDDYIAASSGDAPYHPSDAARSTLQPVECPCAANTCCDQSFRSLVFDATEGIQVQVVVWFLDTWTEQTSGPLTIVVELPAVSAAGGWYTGRHRWLLSVQEL